MRAWDQSLAGWWRRSRPGALRCGAAVRQPGQARAGPRGGAGRGCTRPFGAAHWGRGSAGMGVARRHTEFWSRPLGAGLRGDGRGEAAGGPFEPAHSGRGSAGMGGAKLQAAPLGLPTRGGAPRLRQSQQLLTLWWAGSGRRAGSASVAAAGSGAPGANGGRMSKGREGPAAGGESRSAVWPPPAPHRPGAFGGPGN